MMDYCRDGGHLRLFFLLVVIDEALSRQVGEPNLQKYASSNELAAFENHVRNCDLCKRIEIKQGRWDCVNNRSVENDKG